MQRQSSDDPLGSTVAVSADAPAKQALASKPPLASQSASMGVVDRFAETLVVAALLGELGLVLGNVFARAYFHHSFLWADEVARLSLSILAFVGGAVAYRRRDHAFVRVVLNLVPRPVERTCLALSDIIVLFVVGLTGIASAEFIASSWGERTPIFQIPAALIALPLPLGMALLALYAANNLYRENRRMIWSVGVAFIVVLALAA
jgi:TRAP-type C4-dicarboxylate transport system permease small subunit